MDDTPDYKVPKRVDAVIKAILRFEDGTYKAGYDAGWKAGVDFMVEKIRKDAHAALKHGPVAPPPVLQIEPPQVDEETPPDTPRVSARDEFGPISASDLVLQAIVERQGLRGVELLKRINHWTAPGADMPERTFRTALHRLKKAGEIEIVDGRWFLKGQAPAATQPELPVKPDAPA